MEKYSKLLASVVFTATTAFSLPNTVLANDAPLLATTVPASACTPVDEAQSGKVRISNGAWVFSGAHTGTVTFYCPLNLNGIDVNNILQVNDMSAYRVYFRDSDGGTRSGNRAKITARLIYRKADGMYSGGNLWSSRFTPKAQIDNSTAVKANNHTLQKNALYSFLVTLYRSDSAQQPAFSGIDFPMNYDDN